MSNAICVLANSPLLLKTLVDNIEDKELCKLFVVNEIRYNNCKDELEEILEQSGISYQLISSKTVCAACVRLLKLTDDGLSFFKQYRMGMNVLLPLYFKDYNGKVLFMDDDVLLLKGYEKIFELGTSFQKSTFVNNYREGEQYTEYFLGLADCTGEHWCKNYTANGHFIIDYRQFDEVKYAKLLSMFFNSYTVQGAWEDYISGKRMGKGWFLDMSFITAAAIRLYGSPNYELSKLCVIGQWRDKKTNVPKPNRLLFHYCVRNKEKYVELLKNNGYIK